MTVQSVLQLCVCAVLNRINAATVLLLLESLQWCTQQDQCNLLLVLLWVNALQWCTQWDNWHNFYVHSYNGESPVVVYSTGSVHLIHSLVKVRWKCTQQDHCNLYTYASTVVKVPWWCTQQD